MKKLAVFLLTGLTCASMLFGCGSKNDTVETVPVAEVQESTAAPAETESETETETVEEDVPPEEGMVKSDLTGEWISGDLADQRPIAVMIPDENAALPHYGLSNADILYECSVEGNMTRLMAVFKDWKNIERIGNIRSCRDYYVYWAKEWDAIYCHIGGPFYILNAINDPTTNNITGAVLASDPSQKKGLYDAAFYRTSDRKAPHNAYTSGDRIDKAAQALGYSETYTENYQSDHFKFASTNNPNTLEQYGSSAIPATKIDLAGAYPITKTYFEYNEEDGLYYRFQGMQKGDQKHMDGANNKQLAFKNVLVQFAYYETRDAKGYLSFQCHDDTKDGYYFTNGKGIHVTWKKTSDFAPTKFYDDNGNLCGFDVSMAKIVANSLFGDPEKVKFVEQSSDERVPNLVNGNVDICFQFMTISAERAQQIEFTIPYYTEGCEALLHTNSKYKTGEQLLAAMDSGTKVTVAILQNSFAEDIVADVFAGHDNYTVDQYEDQALLYQALASGRCDVAVCDMSNAKYQASLDSNYIATGIAGRPQNYGAGVQKGDQVWLNYVNTVLQDAMSGATYQSYIDAFEQWFGVKLDPPKTGKPAMYC